jgi:dTMP kinase
MVLKEFFVLEGIDGSGTTTQLQAVSQALASAGRRVHACAEPSSGPVGALIREALSGKFPLSPAAMALLFASDREEHVNAPGGIIERISSGETVLCDRYLFSSLAYQSISADPALPFALNQRFPLPEALYFLDIDPETALGRIGSRQRRDIFETAPLLDSIAARYRSAIEFYRDSGMRIRFLDARCERESITAQILADIGPVSV